MARPAKSVSVISKNLTREEIEAREQTEKNLRGASDRIKPPTYLNTAQKKVFNAIVKELKESNILSNLDIYILASTSIAINRVQEIDKQINDEPLLLQDKNLMSNREKYQKDFLRGTTELCMSPASRAKIGVINSNAQINKEDALMKALGGS